MPQWVSNVPVAKAGYFDRNARPSYHGFSVSVAPHGLTTRVNYTVPYPYAAFWEVVSLAISRATAAGVVGQVAMIVTATNVFGISKVMDVAAFTDNTVNYTVLETITGFGWLGPGDNITIQTYDTSTGGTASFRASVKGTEFEY